MTKWITVASTFALLACQAEGVPNLPDEADGVSTPAETLTADAMRERLRSRLDMEHSKLRLAVDSSKLPRQLPLDMESFKQGLESSLSAKPSSEWNIQNQNYVVFGNQMATMDPQSRNIDVHDSRGYEVDTIKEVSDNELVTIGEELLDSMGIDRAEARSEVVPFGSEAHAVGGATSAPERMGQKVFFFRELDGIPVSGSRMVFSFARDASLRNIRGAWPHVDFSQSQLSSSLSEDEVVERALAKLMESDPDPDATTAITLETFLDIESDSNGQRMRLRGTARTQAMGPDGVPGRGVRFDFDI